MANALCLLNHVLTANQCTELVDTFAVEMILLPPSDLKLLWSSIPTGIDLSQSTFSPIIHWLESVSESGDYLIIQGEFGATFYMVEFAFSHSLIPLHSVTNRIAQESRTDEIVCRSYIFEHIRFRRYIQYEGGSHGYCLSGVE